VYAVSFQRRRRRLEIQFINGETNEVCSDSEP